MQNDHQEMQTIKEKTKIKKNRVIKLMQNKLPQTNPTHRGALLLYMFVPASIDIYYMNYFLC